MGSSALQSLRVQTRDSCFARTFGAVQHNMPQMILRCHPLRKSRDKFILSQHLFKTFRSMAFW